jgi:hypothetical protein
MLKGWQLLNVLRRKTTLGCSLSLLHPFMMNGAGKLIGFSGDRINITSDQMRIS